MPSASIKLTSKLHLMEGIYVFSFTFESVLLSLYLYHLFSTVSLHCLHLVQLKEIKCLLLIECLEQFPSDQQYGGGGDMADFLKIKLINKINGEHLLGCVFSGSGVNGRVNSLPNICCCSLKLR